MSTPTSQRERLQRNPRLVIQSIEPNIWGLFNPDRAGALFIDRFARTLLDAVAEVGDREATIDLAIAAAAGGATDPAKIRAAAVERLDALTRFGALAPAPAPTLPCVLLVDPPCTGEMIGTPGPAKGLCYLAAVLEAAGGVVARVLDLRSVSATLGDRAAQAAAFSRWAGPLRPRVVGITAASATIESACYIAALARLLFPDTFIVLGGPHASYEWETLLREHPAVDAVVLGEGELSFPALVHHVCERPGDRSFEHIQGVAFRHPDGSPRSTGWSPMVESLDALPIPRDREYLLNGAEYPLRVARILTTRGCPFQCSFCSTATFTGRRIRRRAADRVVDEIRAWVRDGVTEFTFDDDIFTADRASALALCQALTAPDLAGRIVWGCNTRLDCIDEALIDAMADAGCRFILFGVESGDAEISQRFGKGRRSLHRFREKIAYVSTRGIEAQLNFILGLPGEDRETLGAVLDLIGGLPRGVAFTFNFLNVFPGTPLARDLERLGIRHLGEHGRDRYSNTAPTVATPTLDGDAQIDAFLRLRWFCETGRDTMRPQAAPAPAPAPVSDATRPSSSPSPGCAP